MLSTSAHSLTLEGIERAVRLAIEGERSAALTRRLWTIPTLVVAAFALTLFAPALFVLAFLVGLVRRRRFIVLRLLFIFMSYLWAEVFGVSAALFGLLTKREDAWFRRLQHRWCSVLFAATRFALSIRFDTTLVEPPSDTPFVVLSRHASLVDTMLPTMFLSRGEVPLRFVLKKELLADPCLDIVGLRLPNLFIDRQGNRAVELSRLGTLSSALDVGEGVIIYPEGTFFSEAKRARRLTQLETTAPHRAAHYAELKHVLPLKPAGTVALLEASPDASVVVLAHSGLEGFGSLRGLLGGELVGTTVHVRTRRIERTELPTGEGLVPALDALWAEVDAFSAERKST